MSLLTCYKLSLAVLSTNMKWVEYDIITRGKWNFHSTSFVSSIMLFGAIDSLRPHRCHSRNQPKGGRNSPQHYTSTLFSAHVSQFTVIPHLIVRRLLYEILRYTHKEFKSVIKPLYLFAVYVVYFILTDLLSYVQNLTLIIALDRLKNVQNKKLFVKKNLFVQFKGWSHDP